MKFKLLLTAIIVLITALTLSAKPLIDSVGVKNNDGKKMVLFKVKAKDTYYSIGRRYHISPEALMKFNGSKKSALSIGAIVEIPTEIPFKKSAKEKESAEVPEKLSKKEKKEKAEREAKDEQEAAEKKEHKHKNENSKDDEETVATPPPAAAPVVQTPVVQQPVQQAPPPPVQQNTAPPTQYKVSAGETLYAISKRFNTTVDVISKLNNLSSTTLQPGQVLLVPTAQLPQPTVAQTPAATGATPPPTPVKPDTTPTTSVVVINKDSSERHLNGNKFGLFEKNEKGVATWMDDPGLDPNKKLVLHRTAPIGTVIKITNPMTNRTTFAKVVGRFTDTEATKDVIIVMTKNVADALGALDKRFHVDLSYGSPNE